MDCHCARSAATTITPPAAATATATTSFTGVSGPVSSFLASAPASLPTRLCILAIVIVGSIRLRDFLLFGLVFHLVSRLVFFLALAPALLLTRLCILAIVICLYSTTLLLI